MTDARRQSSARRTHPQDGATRARALAVAGVIAAGVLSGCARVPDPGTLSGWNVVLITIDTLRADRLGYAGWTAAATPILDELAAAGVVFEDAIAAAPVTLPAHATILTGRYPPAHGALDNGRYPLPSEVPTLTGTLAAAGYETGAIIGSFVLHRKYGLAREFGDYDDRFGTPLAGDALMLERPAEVVTDRAVDWLRARPSDTPFFLWAHYYDPHVPYDPPPPFRNRFASAPYDGEVAYTDSHIGRLLAALRELGHSERTLVVVTSDHGEAFGDGGEQTHGLLLRDSTLRVPLLWVAPGRLPAGRRVPGVVSQADIVPTILELLGIAAPSDLDGESLLTMIGNGRSERRSAYSMTYLPRDQFGWADLSSVRTDDWAWVRAPEPELYALPDDPLQRDNVHDRHPDVVSELHAWLESIESRGVARDATGLDPEDEEALRALGYVIPTRKPEHTGADPKEMIPVWNETNELRELLGQGRHDDILRRVPPLLERDPGNTFLIFYLGRALVAVGRHDEGLEYLRRAFELTGSRVQAGTILARTLAELGRVDESAALLESFVEADPDYAAHAYNLGVLHMSEGRDAEAIEAYEHALTIDSESVPLLVNLASVRARAALDPERALVLVDRAIELAEKDDRPRLVRAEVLDALGRREEARVAATELARAARLRNVARKEVADLLRKLR